jgi:L-arabinonolactonase
MDAEQASIEVLECDRGVLGESPVWSVREQALYWVDIRRQLLLRYDPAMRAVAQWKFDEAVGSVVLRASGGVVLSLTSGFTSFSAESGFRLQLRSPEAHIPNQRFNDGRCDPRGRYWVGSMSDVDRIPTGSLYRIDPDWTAHKWLTGITIPNSLCWSPDGRRMYFADTIESTIFVFDYDLDTGRIANKRVFATTEGRPGRPDGSTVDAEGYLWNAEFGSWCVTRYAPNGRVDRRIHLPAQCPTSCAFGGSALDTLYVTTARHRLSAAEQKAQPLSGQILALHVGARGSEEPEFAG